jgi:hypothetical protein
LVAGEEAEGARAEERTTPASMPAPLTTALPLASAAQLVVRSNGAVLGNGAAAEEAEEEAEDEVEEEAVVEAAEEAAEAAAGGAFQFHQCSASRIARRVSACVNCIRRTAWPKKLPTPPPSTAQSMGEGGERGGRDAIQTE